MPSPVIPDAVRPPARIPVAWGAALVSAAVMVTFIIMLTLVFYRPVPVEMRDVVMALVGCVTTCAISAVNYWLGASRPADIRALQDINKAP